MIPETHIFSLQVYNIKALKMVTDVQFDTMGVAVGQVATIRAKLGEEKANLHSEGIVRINIWPN